MYIISQIISGDKGGDTFNCNGFSLEKKKKANTVLIQHETKILCFFHYFNTAEEKQPEYPNFGIQDYICSDLLDFTKLLSSVAMKYRL